MLAHDTLKNVLTVDLTRKSFRVDERPDLFGDNLGGAGAGIRLLDEECPKGCDPLGPYNPIVLAVGPLTGLFPLASKTVALFKSPHTGNLGESHCGGRSAVALRMAGLGAIVIKGASDMPVYVSVDGDGVGFKDARTLWEIGDSFVVGRIIRERERAPGLRTIMRIGKAGEKLVSYACVTTETYRHFGRLGLGAVFGSKKLVALVVSGKRSLPVADSKAYRTLYDELHGAAVSSDLMRKYHDLGTAENISPLNEIGGLPTRNLTAARFEHAGAVSGEELARHYLGRRLACSHCPVGCIHIAALREPHPLEPYFYKTSMISYDYEPLYALGTMLGVGEPAGFLKLMDAVESVGLDAMSAGVVLAWATEAFERGLVSERETDGLALRWGDHETYRRALELLVEQPNDFYAACARGVERASSVYGGAEFALSLGGNEIPGYHTGPAAHAGVLAGMRHSHLDNAGYSVDQKTLMKERPGPEALAKKLVEEEEWRQVLSSLVVCFFARGLYTPEAARRSLALAGFDLDEPSLAETGRRIYREKYAFKAREGFSFDSLRIPQRILHTPSAAGTFDERYIRDALNAVKGAAGRASPSGEARAGRRLT